MEGSSTDRWGCSFACWLMSTGGPPSPTVRWRTSTEAWRMSTEAWRATTEAWRTSTEARRMSTEQKRKSPAHRLIEMPERVGTSEWRYPPAAPAARCAATQSFDQLIILRIAEHLLPRPPARRVAAASSDRAVPAKNGNCPYLSTTTPHSEHLPA